jgi:hypothetical protein
MLFVYLYMYMFMCRYSDYAAGWTADESGFDSRKGQNLLIFSTASRPPLGLTQPPIQRVLRAVSPELKRTGSEVDHSLPCSVEVKIGGAMLPLLLTSSWRGAYLSKWRDTLYVDGGMYGCM